jgi:DMSO reductase anchor subunit
MNTRDFFHGKSKFFLKSIKTIFIVMVFIVPMAILILVLFKPSFMVLVVACASMFIGLLAERWYFFAEGNHPQNIYYQAIA